MATDTDAGKKPLYSNELKGTSSEEGGAVVPDQRRTQSTADERDSAIAWVYSTVSQHKSPQNKVRSVVFRPVLWHSYFVLFS